MPSWLTLVLALTGCTLVVPALVLAQSTSTRQAFAAWGMYCRYMGALYTVGGLTWLGVKVCS